jgi:leukotriene A-4 hydrolase/aminopeptidase
MPRIDPHSYFDTDQPRVRHANFKWRVDFDRHRIEGQVVLELERASSGTLDLDSKALDIHSVQSDDGKSISFNLGTEEELLGQRLRLNLPPGTRSIRIDYSTSPEALALQWLDPVQTSSKKHPFLFSQCQAINARTVAPIQDSPVARVTYRAEVTVPEPLTAVMSAGPAGIQPGAAPGTRTFLFEMPQPIPPYLLALAVGELASRDLSPRARVWAEPTMVEAAAWEFAGIEPMIVVAEKLFGKYEWDRYDMIVLPPSFPYGGMENPRMTFLTPTLLAGDRSLVAVVCHELAHSWTGNLITNATWEHFWLNEGFTVWAERRIVEALNGEAAAVLGWAIGQNELEESLERFGPGSSMTKLRCEMKGVDPDEALSSVPYEKGARLLSLIERTVGRSRFDEFVRAYIAKFRFTSITTEEFIEFLETQIPGTAEKVGAKRWLYEPDMPNNAPVFRSSDLDTLTALADEWTHGKRPSPAQVKEWNPSQLLIYIQHLPRELSIADCEWLDNTLQLTKCGNYEILVEWLAIAASSDYESAFDRLREVLTHVGRVKYLRRLYGAMGRHSRTRALARSTFAAVAAAYHPLSRRIVEGLIEKWAE